MNVSVHIMSVEQSETIEVIAEINMNNGEEVTSDDPGSVFEQNTGTETSNMAAAATKFDFDKWSSFLSRNTTKTLRKEELTTAEMLVLLSPDDTRHLGVTMGQKMILDAAIADLRADRSTGTRLQSIVEGNNNQDETLHVREKQSVEAVNMVNLANPNASKTTIKDIRQQKQDLIMSGKEFDLQFSSLPPVAPSPHNTAIIAHPSPSGPSPLPMVHHSDSIDPRTVLTTKACTKKAVHITSFLSESAKKRLRNKKKDNIVLARDEGQGIDRLVLQHDDSHPYAGIMVSEWAAANCRVMNKLLATGDLHRENVEYYLAYTATVMDFASLYEWSSVLDFDCQYREHQAEHNFQWGYINPLLKMQVLGNPRQASNHHRPSPHNNAPRSRSYPRHENVPECRQWKANNGFCAFGNACKYRHVDLARPPPPQIMPSQNNNQQAKNEFRPPQNQRSW